MDRITRRETIFRRSLALADAIAIAVALLTGTVVLGDDSPTVPIVAAFFLLILLMKLVGLYDRDAQLLHKSTLDEVPALLEVATLSALLVWLAGDVLVSGDLGRRQILGMWGLLFVLLIVGRAAARVLARRIAPPERCLLLGDAAAARLLGDKLEMARAVRAELVGRLPLERLEDGNGGLADPDLPETLQHRLTDQQIDRVILAPGPVDSDALVHLVRRLTTLKVSVSVLPATPPVAGSSPELDRINGVSLLGIRGFEMQRSSRLLKRSFDLVTSTLMLLISSPLLFAIAIAIKLDSRGPMLFKQRRIGRDGRSFEMLKFRSMSEGAEEERDALMGLNEAEGLFKIERDPRVTRVGRVIRRWSLDELPQLVNVVRGEMSLVGPRPLVPAEDSLIVGRYRRRLDLAPGMTGYWQVLGAFRIPLSEMVRLDYLYVATWSLWHDVQILLRTVPYVVGRRGR